MRLLRFQLALALTVFVTIVQGRDPYPRQEAIDVLHYSFRIELNDTTDIVAGRAQVEIKFLKPVSSFFLDLAGRDAGGMGMTVHSVKLGETALSFTHTEDRLILNPGTAASAGQVLTITIVYSGVPKDGFIISKSKFGDRTFFADHWPDRGHQWLPCIDHPSDKASVEWMVVAPTHYQVVATGRKLEETSLTGGRRLTHYREWAPVAVKVMAVGVARFAVREEGLVDTTAQSTWVYPQNDVAGFQDFKPGVDIFRYFQNHIGPFVYAKLAHVQSKTRWGGLENAGNIFYGERSVSGTRSIDHLIAHEAAHQWFGDAVTESDWHHVWLSEGFANYFANLYYEHAYGKERFLEEMRKERELVIHYFRTNPNPVVDTTIQNINKVLNTNVYQKACWVLHMLRREVGDDAFWNGIRNYYGRYRNGNVVTRDFQVEMEHASGKDLGPFFQQWLFRGGHPVLDVSWQQKKSAQHVTLEVVQGQPEPREFPLTVRFMLADGSPWDQKLSIRKARQSFELKPPARVTSVVLDPDCNLLFEGTVRSK